MFPKMFSRVLPSNTQQRISAILGAQPKPNVTLIHVPHNLTLNHSYIKPTQQITVTKSNKPKLETMHTESNTTKEKGGDLTWSHTSKECVIPNMHKDNTLHTNWIHDLYNYAHNSFGQ